MDGLVLANSFVEAEKRRNRLDGFSIVAHLVPRFAHNVVLSGLAGLQYQSVPHLREHQPGFDLRLGILVVALSRHNVYYDGVAERVVGLLVLVWCAKLDENHAKETLREKRKDIQDYRSNLRLVFRLCR